jgi:L-ascorbate metabolism protein UlaG (beta-lactamase superfamily)
LLWALSGCAAWHGPVTDHFDGTRFHTPGAPERYSSIAGVIKWNLHRDEGPWSPARDVPPGPTPPHRVGLGQMRVTFINHATTLLQLDRLNVLTDPVWMERASPVQLVGPRRVRPPGIAFEELPPIDVVLLSHAHYDHLDVTTLRRLQDAFPMVQIFCGLGIKQLLVGAGLHHVHQFDWGNQAHVGEVTFRSTKNQHFSNRGLTDMDHSLWTAWTLTGTHAGKAYFAGDTGYGAHFKEAGDAQGPFRLAVLPIGAFRPEWFMSAIHEDPKQAVQAAIDLRAKTAVPMHFGTFPLADDGEVEAVDLLRAEVAARGYGGFKVLDFGEGLDVP